MDIMGFKSFPERVQVHFAKGISAVVGPNGCGKSNIVDAIRWVMGEQSPKQLRGRNMEDILFNGAKSHQPAGMAEVTIVMANDSVPGMADSIGPSEISLTRRLYRSGDSEYLINKVPCRLKDITQFFMDTGMGTKAYSIIEQGRIGFLVDARPEDRRTLIDEAAGITRYKVQKKEAERKIEATEQNLTHISTVMHETKRQINTLTRAAAKAARYKDLKDQLKQLDIMLAAVDLKELSGKKEDALFSKQELDVRLTGLLSELETMELELEKTRLEIVQHEKTAEEKAAAHYELQGEYERLKQEDQFIDARIQDAQVRQVRLGEELIKLTGQKEGKAEELERLQEDLYTFRSEADEKTAYRDALRSEFAELKGEYDQAVNERDDLSRSLSDIRSRCVRLEEIVAGHERMEHSHAARNEEITIEIESLRSESSAMNQQVEQLVRQKEDFEFRIDDARIAVTEKKEELAACMSEVQRIEDEERRVDSNLARTSSRLATLKDVQANFGWYPDGVKAVMAAGFLRDKGVIGPVAENISIPQGYEQAAESGLGERLQFILVKDRNAAVAALDFLKNEKSGRCGFVVRDELGSDAESSLTKAMLGDFALAETMEEAVTRHPGRPVLTRDGVFFGPNGLVVGGKPEKQDKGLLARLRDMDELEVEVEALENEKERLELILSEARLRVDGVTSALARIEEEAKVAQGGMMEIEKQLSALTGRKGEIEGRLSSAVRAMESLAVEAERIVSEKESAESEKQSLEDSEFDITSDLEESAERVAVLTSQLENLRERGQEASLEVSALAERLANAEREIVRTREWLSDIESQSVAKENERENAADEQERLYERRSEIAEKLSGFDERLQKSEEGVAVQRKKVDELRIASNEKENAARRARKERTECDEKISKLDLDLQELNFSIKSIVEKIEADYRLDMNNLPEEEEPITGPGLDIELARNNRDDARRKIEEMGEVNLTAINEHEALMERYKFYNEQYDDLTNAINDLKDSIAKINRTCKIRFSSTFKAVDEKLREIFPLLFEGGEAWLSLTDESDPLESGVEIHVHPPGKRLTVMSLLSGGEKALVALALIFALYLIKPSPFCMLDETDAPLDEANIDRFNRLLQKLGQSSQIIMVTHNKRTMQISETLYGVTMEEPGCSKMVSVNLSDIEELEEDAKLVQAG